MDYKADYNLMLLVMKTLSERFKAQAILRGGMALYLLNSKRYTNDLDYAFVPYKSKNDIVNPVIEVLSALGLEVTYSLNSKCLRIFLSNGSGNCQLEIKTFKTLNSQPITVSSFPELDTPPFVVRIARLDWSLAQKIAAYWERRLARDLYDIYFIYVVLNTKPDLEALSIRIRKFTYARNISGPKVFENLNLFATELSREAAKLNTDQIESNLRNYYSQEEVYGLGLKIIMTLNQICDYLCSEPLNNIRKLKRN